jgi:hypothetical protein
MNISDIQDIELAHEAASILDNYISSLDQANLYPDFKKSDIPSYVVNSIYGADSHQDKNFLAVAAPVLTEANSYLDKISVKGDEARFLLQDFMIEENKNLSPADRSGRGWSHLFMWFGIRMAFFHAPYMASINTERENIKPQMAQSMPDCKLFTGVSKTI